jgi:hypothetical protein
LESEKRAHPATHAVSLQSRLATKKIHKATPRTTKIVFLRNCSAAFQAAFPKGT